MGKPSVRSTPVWGHAPQEIFEIYNLLDAFWWVLSHKLRHLIIGGIRDKVINNQLVLLVINLLGRRQCDIARNVQTRLCWIEVHTFSWRLTTLGRTFYRLFTCCRNIIRSQSLATATHTCMYIIKTHCIKLTYCTSDSSISFLDLFLYEDISSSIVQFSTFQKPLNKY